MSGYTYTAAYPAEPLTLDKLEAAIAKVQALPKPQWLLVSPNGDVWAAENPADLMRVCMAHTPIGSFGGPGSEHL